MLMNLSICNFEFFGLSLDLICSLPERITDSMILYSFQKPSWEKAAMIMRERYMLLFMYLLYAWWWVDDKIHNTIYWPYLVYGYNFHHFIVLYCHFYVRHDPEADGRILMGKVDCTVQVDLCRRYFSTISFFCISC